MVQKGILEKIRKLEYRDRIPPERDLAKKYQVNVLTVKKAINTLVDDGIVYRRQGSGTYISPEYDTKKNSKTKNLVAIFSKSNEVTLHFPLIRLLTDQLQQAGVLTINCNPDDNSFLENPEKKFKEIFSYYPKAAVVESTEPSFYESLKYLQNRIPKTIFINSIDSKHIFNASCILRDNWMGVYKITRHLINLGHRKIIMKGSGFNYPVTERRFHSSYDAYCGYRDALTEAGYAGEECVLLGKVEDPEFATDLEKRFKRKNRPTAIICPMDYNAVKIINILHKIGLRVPEDVAVTGMGNTPWALEMIPQLTTIDYKYDEIARLAAEKITSPKSENEKILVEPELIIRQSCGAEQ